MKSQRNEILVQRIVGCSISVQYIRDTRLSSQHKNPALPDLKLAVPRDRREGIHRRSFADEYENGDAEPPGMPRARSSARG